MRRRAIDRHPVRGQPGALLCVLMFVVAVFALLSIPARAAAPIFAGGFDAPAIETISIPPTSYLYRVKLEREVIARFGDSSAVARIAGQVHQESRWRADARSPYAEGMGQFRPSTAAWLQSVCPEIGPPDPWDPQWSVRAVVCYDHYLHARVDGATPCDRWAFALAAYNGGLSWVQRDKSRASASGADSARWFGQVEHYSARSARAKKENRGYVRRILTVTEPAYLAAGWIGEAVCR